MADDGNVHDLAKAREKRRKQVSDLDAQLARNTKGVPLGTLSNIILIVGRDPVLAGLCGFDEFSSVAVLHAPPPVPLEGETVPPGPYPRQWLPSDVACVQSYVQRVWTKYANRETIEDAIRAVASLRRFHPVRDWLATLKWDGVPRLDSWLTTAFGCPADDYHTAIGSKFLIAAVRRVRHPGCKFDHMPVFEGAQNIGKSTLLRVLFSDCWFCDTLPAALESRDAALGLQGVWCVEFAEIEQIIRAEVEIIKAFLSRSVDRFRAPYGRAFLTYPRQSVMAGTTNDCEYLRDTTGNRRFWPVACLFADVEWVAANRAQLWAEAAAREASGEAHWLVDADLIVGAQRAARERMQEDVWADRVLEFVAGRLSVTVPEILEHALMVPVAHQGRREMMRVAGILRLAGWVRSPPAWSSDRQKTVRSWERTPG